MRRRVQDVLLAAEVLQRQVQARCGEEKEKRETQNREQGGEEWEGARMGAFVGNCCCCGADLKKKERWRILGQKESATGFWTSDGFARYYCYECAADIVDAIMERERKPL